MTDQPALFDPPPVPPASDDGDQRLRRACCGNGCQELLARVAAEAHDAGVGFHFVSADRGQQFLLPPDMADWLPQDHLAWFVIDVVERSRRVPTLVPVRWARPAGL